MMPAPTLTTARLVLRPYQMGDFADFAGFVASDRTAHMGGPYQGAQAVATAWAWFCNDVAQWALRGMGGLMIALQGRLLGNVTLCQSPDFPEPELGWALFAPADEGQGYAREAARALLDWALGARGLATVVSYIDAGNAPSRRLAADLGGVVDASAATPNGAQTMVYRWGQA